jgi:hypothetical protein
MKRLNSLSVVLFIFSIMLTACGGGATSDPIATVKAAMDAVVNKQPDKIAELACTANKEKIINELDRTSQLTNGGLDITTTQQLLDSMTLTFVDASFTKVSEGADAAQVRMKGMLTTKFDREKLKAVVVKLFKSRGMDATDATINQALDQVDSQLGQGQPIDSAVDLVKENGKWAICSIN